MRSQPQAETTSMSVRNCGRTRRMGLSFREECSEDVTVRGHLLRPRIPGVTHSGLLFVEHSDRHSVWFPLHAILFVWGLHYPKHILLLPPVEAKVVADVLEALVDIEPRGHDSLAESLFYGNSSLTRLWVIVEYFDRNL